MSKQSNLPIEQNSSTVMQQIAAQVRKELLAAQDELGKITKQSEAGDGLVKVTLNGLYEIVALKIDPELLTTDVRITEGLIMEALNYAVLQIRDYNTQTMLKIIEKTGVGDLADSEA